MTWKEKAKINKWDYVNEKASHSKENHVQNEEVTYGIGEDIYKPYIW